MASPSFKHSTPGSLMLMGEYAVLRGYPAIVAAINRYIHVTLTPRDDDRIEIYSALGDVRTTLQKLTITPPLEYVLATLLHYPIKQGCTIQIEAEFSNQQGLGSSAAVTVALIMALNQWHSQYNLLASYKKALFIVRQVQDQASGADVAASLWGGTMAYQQNPLSIEYFNHVPEMTVIFSGSKTTTTDALSKIKWQNHPLIPQLGKLSERAIVALRQNHLTLFADLMQRAQQVMVELELSTPHIDAMVKQLTRQGIQGVKMSGAGLGDCVIALGPIKPLDAYPILPIQLLTATPSSEL